jgi:hypothetical protein
MVLNVHGGSAMAMVPGPCSARPAKALAYEGRESRSPTWQAKTRAVGNSSASGPVQGRVTTAACRRPAIAERHAAVLGRPAA